MKSGILQIITIALLIVNLVVSGLIMIVAVPSMSNTNKLVKKVSSTIELDLEKKRESGDVVYEAKDLQPITIGANAAGDDLKFTVGSNYIVAQGVISLYTPASDYATISKMIPADEAAEGAAATSKLAMVRTIIQDEVLKHDFKDIKSNSERETIEKNILTRLQETFSKECVVKFAFSKYQTQ